MSVLILTFTKTTFQLSLQMTYGSDHNHYGSLSENLMILKKVSSVELTCGLTKSDVSDDSLEHNDSVSTGIVKLRPRLFPDVTCKNTRAHTHTHKHIMELGPILLNFYTISRYILQPNFCISLCFTQPIPRMNT